MSTLILAIIVTILFLIFNYFKKKYSYFEDRGIPSLKPSIPAGDMSGVGRTTHIFDVILKVYSECKGKDVIAGFYNFFQPIYMVTDGELAKNIMIKDFNNFVNRGMYIEEEEPLTGHLFSIEDEKWRFLRNKLSPAFTSGKLKAMYPIITNKGDNLVAAIEKKLNNGESIEIKNIANRFTVDVISSVAFGMEADTLKGENEQILKVFSGFFGGTSLKAQLTGFILMTYPKFGKLLNLKLFNKEISDFFMNVVGTNIKHREDSKDNRNDFLNMLIQLKNKGSIDGEFSKEQKKLTLHDVMAQAFLFFFAGADTSSTTASFALVELSRNQEIQDRLRKEINEKTKAANGEITYENLQEMTYLNQVVDEALRMYTPGFIQFRKSTNDYHIPRSKHILPKGSTIWIPAIAFHYDERFYANPEKFDPERFTPAEIEKRPNFVYLPFGEGPRNCIGMRLGLINVKLAIASIVRNYKLTPSSKTQYPIKINPKAANIEPIGGFYADFEKIV